MLSDIENLDIMLGENHFDRNEMDESISSNRTGRPESASGDEFDNNDGNRYLDTRGNGLGTNADYGRNSTGGNSSAEINRLSSELNSRLSRELDEMMSSVKTQIQRAISDAISGQMFPQIQSVLNAGSSQSTFNRWNVPSERPGINSEVLLNANSRDNPASMPNRPCEGPAEFQAYDSLQNHKDCYHMDVNDSGNFVESKTSAHTQSVESMWRDAKMRKQYV